MCGAGVVHVLDASRAAITDLGRSGVAQLGMQTGGAADQIAARTANILVGNAESAPLIEASLLPLEVRIDFVGIVSITGAVESATIDGAPLAVATPVLTWPGAIVRVQPGAQGVHAYLAVHGEIDAPRLQRSVAPDVMLGHGVELAPGTTVSVRGCRVIAPPALPLFRLTPDRILRHRRTEGRRTLAVLPGPEVDEFPALLPTLIDAEFTVGRDSDTAGTRLEGHSFVRATTSEILSRGVPLGAVEIPPSGALIALQRHRPLTAGYPIPLVVARAAHHELAQLSPGSAIALRLVGLDEARSAHARLESALDELRGRAARMYAAAETFPPAPATTAARPPLEKACA